MSNFRKPRAYDQYADYLTLSKMLWLGSHDITIKHYARIFNVSIAQRGRRMGREK